MNNQPGRQPSLRLDEYTHGLVYDVLEGELFDRIETGQIVVDCSVDGLCHDLAAVIVEELMR